MRREKATERITLRVQPAELAAFRAVAAREGLTVSAAIREMARTGKMGAQFARELERFQQQGGSKNGREAK